MKHRLPRRRDLGRGYVVEIAFVSARTLAQILDAEADGPVNVDGVWEPTLGETPAGRIYIDQRLSLSRKWEVYWHEMVHAINDVMAYDRDRSLVT